MNQNAKVLIIAASLVGLAAQTWSGECTYGPVRYLLSGHDGRGYYVRSEKELPVGASGQRVPIQPVADYLASEADATVLYMWWGAERDLPRGEWRGPDPLSALKAFASAAGLEVETPSPDLWVVGTPFWNERSATTIFARPLDPEKQGFQPVSQVGNLERALINQLPVRDGCGRLRRCSIGVSYYFLPDEGPEVLLVQATIPRGSINSPPQTKVFKVHLDRTGPMIRVDCLWASGAIGPLLPDIAEDLDGDGSRDFVFAGGKYDYGANEVLSGPDGHRLIEFIGTELLVEKGTSGAKRVGVATLVRQYSDLRGTTRQPPSVLAYSSESHTFGAVSTDNEVRGEAVAMENKGAERAIDQTRQTFAAAVGGPANVRAYVLFRSPTRPTFRVEEITVRHVEPDKEITPELVQSGFPARVWFQYKSPSYLEEERRKAAVQPE